MAHKELLSKAEVSAAEAHFQLLARTLALVRARAAAHAAKHARSHPYPPTHNPHPSWRRLLLLPLLRP